MRSHEVIEIGNTVSLIGGPAFARGEVLDIIEINGVTYAEMFWNVEVFWNMPNIAKLMEVSKLIQVDSISRNANYKEES